MVFFLSAASIDKRPQRTATVDVCSLTAVQGTILIPKQSLKCTNVTNPSRIGSLAFAEEQAILYKVSVRNETTHRFVDLLRRKL
ncbi:hypothetical protein Aduo_002824 [Ancylostoma duodenale]